MDAFEVELVQCVRLSPVDDSVDAMVSDLIFTAIKDAHDKAK